MHSPVRWAIAAISLSISFVSTPPVGGAGEDGACSLQATDGIETRFMNLQHEYRIYVPATITGRTRALPLLVTFHGLTSDSAEHALETDWADFAESHDFIVAFPESPIGAWLWGPDSWHATFARDVVSDIAETYCVDTTRVFASGYSNGAQMAQRLACDASAVFASVTEYAGASPGSLTCTPARPVAVGLFHGTADQTVPIDDGREARDEWVGRSGCTTPPATVVLSDGLVEAYSCAAQTHVVWREYNDQTHRWPGLSRGDDLRDRMWRFHMDHPLPSV